MSHTRTQDLAAILKDFQQKQKAKNYRQILGLTNEANQTEVNAAYKALALKYHPDKNNKTDSDYQNATEIFKILSDAHENFFAPLASEILLFDMNMKPMTMNDLANTVKSYKEMDDKNGKATLLARKLAAESTSADQIIILNESKKEIASFLSEPCYKSTSSALVKIIPVLFYEAQLFFIKKMGGVNGIKQKLGNELTEQSFGMKDLIDAINSPEIKMFFLKSLDDTFIRKMYRTTISDDSDFHKLDMILAYAGPSPGKTWDVCLYVPTWKPLIVKDAKRSKVQPEEVASFIFKKLSNQYLGDELTDSSIHYRSDKRHASHLLALQVIDADYLKSITPTPDAINSIIKNIEYGYTAESPCPTEAHKVLFEKLGKEHVLKVFSSEEKFKTFLTNIKFDAYPIAAKLFAQEHSAIAKIRPFNLKKSISDIYATLFGRKRLSNFKVSSEKEEMVSCTIHEAPEFPKNKL